METLKKILFHLFFVKKVPKEPKPLKTPKKKTSVSKDSAKKDKVKNQEKSGNLRRGKMEALKKFFFDLFLGKSENTITYCNRCGAWISGNAGDIHQNAIIKMAVCPKCKGGK